MTDRRVLENWKEIGAYLGRTGKTCRNWEKEYGLPVHRLDGSPSAHVFAYTDELERWKAEMLREEQKHKGTVHGLEWEKELLGQNKAGRLILRLLPRLFRRPVVAIPGAIILVAAVTSTVWFFDRQSKIRWARNTALPELERMVEAAEPLLPNNSFEVLNLFEKCSKYLPHDPKIKELRPLCVAEVNVETEPSQARVFIKEYFRPESEWRPVGLSPVDKGRLPNGYLRWRIEKEGYDPIEFVGASSPHYDDMKDVFAPRTIKRVLDKIGIVPPGMARIGGYNFGKDGRFEGYLIDKYEVSNIEYKDFVDSGGYGRREFWKHAFVKEGKPLSWEEGIVLFKDSTGRPGPASWVGGTYPDGQADYPVAGVSWYEAAAFAEFKKKSLPLLAHWLLAQGMDADHRPPSVLELPFLNIEGSGPLPVGSKQGLNQNGVYDLEGNVWEWLGNDCRDGKCIAGGAWNDPIYQTGISYLPSFERSPRVGFRSVIGPDPRKIPDFALRPYTPPPPKRDFYKEKPVSDVVFEVYREQFSYDKTDLQAKVEKRDDSPPDWIEEKVSFAAAYGGERVLGRLFLSRGASPAERLNEEDREKKREPGPSPSPERSSGVSCHGSSLTPVPGRPTAVM